jgi:uncharacterized membrane protein (UPF0127 family)/Flp pilus assembly protein TadG
MKENLAACAIVTVSGVHVLRVRVASSFIGRFRGLMMAGLQRDEGLLLTRCASIHTCFMRQNIDVLYLDGTGVVNRCVSDLPPWRMSLRSYRDGHDGPGSETRHVLELRAGTISRLKIRKGARLEHPYFLKRAGKRGTAGSTAGSSASQPARAAREKGSAMIEFAVMAPVITLMGLAILQYGLLFFAKNQFNHAAFMAARAGSMGHADINRIRQAYVGALLPMYSASSGTVDLAAAGSKAQADVDVNLQIEMLNPTAESFADFNDVALQKALGTGSHRVIPNGGLAYKKAIFVPAGSGQNIQDANLLKLRLTHAYKPQVPLIGAMVSRYLKWTDSGANGFSSQKISQGLIPVVMHVTLHMQSDAIEGTTVSSPGVGNGGTPVDPGMPPAPRPDAPPCATIFCTGNPAGAGGSDSDPGAGGSDGSGGSTDPGGSDGGGTEAPGGPCLQQVASAS